MRDMIKIVRTDEQRIRNMLDDIKKQFNSDEHGIAIIESSVGWQIKVKPQFAGFVRHLTPYQDLSRGLLRVLALVAYKQPITQSQIVKVIGNRTYEYVKRLEERGLVRTIKHGRTKALVATKEFAAYFGMESPEDIKKFFEQIVSREQQTAIESGKQIDIEAD
jgi:segregation and condensation protein B